MLEATDNVLRGGSWNNTRDNARCAYRNDNNPANFNDNNGFRLATRAPRPPEMQRDALISSGGHAAEVFKENDRPLPGSPCVSQTPPAPLPVVCGHPLKLGAGHIALRPRRWLSLPKPTRGGGAGFDKLRQRGNTGLASTGSASGVTCEAMFMAAVVEGIRQCLIQLLGMQDQWSLVLAHVHPTTPSGLHFFVSG